MLRALMGVLDGDTKKSRGKAGEKDTIDILKLHSYKKSWYYQIIYNFEFKRIDDSNYQIDIIYINNKGVFVIEVKDWEGRVEGSINDEIWIRTKNKRIYQYKNPLIQNQKHIEKLSKYIPLPIPIHSLVVFASNNASHLNISNVVSITKMGQHLDNVKCNNELSNQEIDDLYEQLLKLQTNS